ncbi:hypothetical protein ABT187_38560, partial [Streptomyces sp. NPDC001817]
MSAPDDLRAELRKLKRPAQVTRCAQMRDRPAQGVEHRMTARALRSTAQRIQTLQTEAKELENEILSLVRQLAPELLDLLGVGPITAAQVLVSWSHPGRFRSDPSVGDQLFRCSSGRVVVVPWGVPLRGRGCVA